MPGPITGLHHVTATVAHAQPDLDFFAGVLGLRLVKRTVNFDNHGVYHFYYGDELGTPGSLYTTFPYAGMGVRIGTKGAGQVTSTAFSVPSEALDMWRRRLHDAGIPFWEDDPRFDEPILRVEDHSGLVLELIGSDLDARSPWRRGPVEMDAAIRGLHSVTLTVRDPEPTLALLTDVLGWSIVGEVGARTRLATDRDVPGSRLDVLVAANAPAAVNGIGTVHHVAMAIPDGAMQLALREELVERGLKVTEVRDRHYFTSIYFREPGGVLYEVATAGPGFTVDEDPATLGQGLKLPPDAESERPVIETTLPDVTLPAG